MPLKYNGTTIPKSFIVMTVMAVSSIIGLGYQVNANDTAIKEQAQTPIRLVKIEMTLQNQEKAIKELKDEVKTTAKEQAETMKLILEAVRK